MSRIEDAFKRLARQESAPAGSAGETTGESSVTSFDRYPAERQLKRAETGLVEVGAPQRVPSAQSIRPAPVSEHTMRSATVPHPVPRAVPNPDPPAQADAHQGGDNEKLIDVQQIADYAGFVLRAVFRHKTVAALICILMLAATAGAVWVWPKTYQVQTKLLAQRNDVMAALVNPGRTVPRDADAPTRVAADTVLRRENLVALIKQTDLLSDWDRTRPPVMKFKDKVSAYIKGEPTPEERFDGLVGLLEKQLTVGAGVEGIVTINIDWNEPRMAFELASAALQSYLQARQAVETSAIADSISILERTSESLQDEVNRTIAELESKQVRTPASRVRNVPVLALPQPAPAPVPVQAAAPSPSQPSPETLLKLARLKAALDAKRQDIARLEAVRRQQIQEADAKLSAALTIYTEGHPAVGSLRQTVESLSRESPDLSALRAEAQNLETQYAAAIAQPEEPLPSVVRTASEPVSQPSALPGRRSSMPQTTTTVADSISLANMGPDYVNPTSLRLRVELTELATIRERTNSARAELATSQASFKYRYSIIRPPQMPKGPIKPNVAAVLLAGFVGSIMLAVAAAVALDLLSGRIVEAWQVHRLAGIPVLGTLGRL